MEVFVKYLGLSPLEAITCATRNGDVALRLPDEVGIIQAGALADAIVVDGDPLSGIRLLGDRSRLTHVFSGGKSVDLPPRGRSVRSTQAKVSGFGRPSR